MPLGLVAIAQPLRLTSLLRGGVTGALMLAPVLAAAGVFWVQRSPVDPSPLLVLAVAGLLGAVVWAVVNLQHFILVAVLGAMAFPHPLVSSGGALVAAADLLLLLALGAWLVRAATAQGPSVFIRGNSLVAPCLCFAVVAVLSLGWSVDRFATAKAAAQIIEIVVVVTLLYASLPRTLAAVRRGLTVYVLLTSGLALFATFTFATHAAKGDFSPLYVAGLHKNALGSFLGVGLVLALALSLDRRCSRGLRAGLQVAALIELAGLAGTMSRGAALGAIFAALVVSIVIRRDRLRTLVIVALAAAALVVVVGRAGAQRADLGGYSSTSVRNLSWADGVEKIRQHPVLGTGMGTYWAELEEVHIGLSDPNNLLLLTWAELGLAGLAALFFLFWRYGRAFVAARRLPEEARVLALAAGGAALSLLVHFQLDVTWTRGAATMCFALIGLMAAAYRLGAAADPVAASAPAASAPAAATVVPPPQQRPLRVLHLVTSDGYAGIERHVAGLAKGLRAVGVDCMIGCPPLAARLRAEAASAGIGTVPPVGEGRRGAWLPRLTERLAADPPDIVHVHDGAAAVWGWRVASLTKTRLVRTQHFVRPASSWRGGWRRQGSLALHRSLNADVDAVVAVSEAVADGIRSRREVRREAVSVIPPGIDLPSDEIVAAADDERAGLRHPVVAYVGRFETEKGLSLLLDAAPLVLDRLPGCRFVLAGSGSLEPALRAQAQRLHIEHAVEWLGQVPEPGPVFARAHVFVNPTPAEAFGLATAEAMGHGLPVVAHASGAGVELVEHGVTGFLVRAADPAELADAIAQLAGDRALAARMGEAGRRRALVRFGAERTVELTRSLYERITA